LYINLFKGGVNLKTHKILCNFTKEENGAVVVIIALFMTILIGFAALVVDLGLSYNYKSDLQKDLDGVALAAVRELTVKDETNTNWSNALSVADYYAEKNGIQNRDKLQYEKVEKNGKIIGIKVTGEVDVTYKFAKVLGYESGKVMASSTAELRPVNATDGIIPFGLDYETFSQINTNSSGTIYFDSNQETATGGWFGILGVDDGAYTSEELKQFGSNWFDYQVALVNGSRNGVTIGTIVDMETGKMGNAVKTAYDTRMAGHLNCYLDGTIARKSDGTVCEGCPRIATVPIVIENEYVAALSESEIAKLASDLKMDAADLTSLVENVDKKEVIVTALATVFIQDLLNTGGQNYQLQVKYVGQNVLGGNAVAGFYKNDFGVYAAKLVDNN
jgi:Flp pilus assembly protein TadG